VAYVAFGPDAGKLVTIVDVIDQNRVNNSLCEHDVTGFFFLQYL
jgi:ribosomal protein L14E/L6E/L27E